MKIYHIESKDRQVLVDCITGGCDLIHGYRQLGLKFGFKPETAKMDPIYELPDTSGLSREEFSECMKPVIRSRYEIIAEPVS